MDETIFLKMLKTFGYNFINKLKLTEWMNLEWGMIKKIKTRKNVYTISCKNASK